MVLADTSVWIAHFRYGKPELADYLTNGFVYMHPWISGELACGNLKNRKATLSDLHALPSAQVASDQETFDWLERHHLWGKGLGWIDIHLLVSSVLSNCQIRTLDKRLAQAARDMGLS
jgi:predicted nucleic acid-binding protein